MSSDVHAYRASAELAAALRAYRDADREFSRSVVEFDAAHPGHEILWSRSPFSTQQHAVGFRDGEDDVPAGLSRAKTRTELRPRKGKAGDEWQAVLDRMSRRPSVERVWSEFGVRAHGDGPGNGRGGYYIAPTQWFDAADEGVIVVCKYDIGVDHNGEAIPMPHLTSLRLSEFYRIKEAAEAAERAVPASTGTESED